MKDHFPTADFMGLIVARSYELQHGHSHVTVGRWQDYDVCFSDGVRAEVKVDWMASRTKNIAVEYWNSRKNAPSGITATTSTMWIHCIQEGRGFRCFEVQTKLLLKALIEEGSTASGGDNRDSLIKLLPLQRLKELSESDVMIENAFTAFILDSSRPTPDAK